MRELAESAQTVEETKNRPNTKLTWNGDQIENRVALLDLILESLRVF